jgi:long-subunit fatty acid transport protein
LKGKARVDANRTVNTAVANLAKVFVPVFQSLFPNRASQGFASEYQLRVHNFAHPQRLALGLAHDASTRLRLSGEYTWINWASTFDRFRVTLSRGTNPDVNEFVGGDTTASNTYLEWRDQHMLAAAAEYRLRTDLVLRGGWSWAENPVPRRTVSATGAGIQEHHLAGGLTFELESVDLDLGVVWALPKTVTSSKISKSDANADNTRIRQYMLVYFLGLSYRY